MRARRARRRASGCSPPSPRRWRKPSKTQTPGLEGDTAAMVERRRFGNLFAYAVLSLGVFIVAFPVYLCLIGSTHEQSVIANGQMPITPGKLFYQTYYKTLFVGT